MLSPGAGGGVFQEAGPTGCFPMKDLLPLWIWKGIAWPEPTAASLHSCAPQGAGSLGSTLSCFDFGVGEGVEEGGIKSQR